jgi:putative NIF3 family GTP cyclohydrolase 1 type 2
MAAQLSVDTVTQRLGAQFGSSWHADPALGFGAAGSSVSGIAVTWTPTMDVLRRAVAKRQNLILSLEPPFWNGKAIEGRPVAQEQLEPDATYKLKKAYLEQNRLSVVNVRDGWTARAEDGQLRGLSRALGWDANYRPQAGMARWARGNDRFELPNGRFGDLAKNIKQQLKARTIRCIGDPGTAVSKVALTHGYFLVADMEKVLAGPPADLVICGEACEWEAGPYFMDLIASGQKKAMILLGSQVSSEPGCGELAAWVRGFISEVPVEWLPAGEPFQAVS